MSSEASGSKRPVLTIKNVLVGSITLIIISFLCWGTVFGVIHWGTTYPFFFVGHESERISWAVTAAIATAGGIGTLVTAVVRFQKMKMDEREEERQISAHNETVTVKNNEMLDNYEKELTSGAPENAITALQGITNLADKFYSNNHLGGIGDVNQRCVDAICYFVRRVGKSPAAMDLETIQGVAFKIIQKHVARNSINSWSACTFDLHDAVIVAPVEFGQVRFNNDLNLAGVKFEKTLSVEDGYFKKLAMDGVTVCGDTTFKNVTFEELSFGDKFRFVGKVDFEGSTFRSTISVRGQLANGAVTSAGSPVFEFGGKVSFKNATFKEHASFNGVCFARSTDFSNATLTALDFTYCLVKESLLLDNATYTRGFIFDYSMVEESFQLRDLRSPENVNDGYIEFNFYETKIGEDLLLDNTILPEKTNINGLEVSGTICPPNALTPYKSQP